MPATPRTARHGAKTTTEIVFPGKVPGNNGPGGLLRMHWAAKAKFLASCMWLVRFATKAKHTGPVRLELVRYSTGGPMDYDNLVSTGKFLVDAVVRAGVLPDDNPHVIAERHYSQVKAKSKADQRTVLRIIDLPAVVAALTELTR